MLAGEFDCQKINKSKQIDVVLLAPNSYWNHWLDQTQYKDAQTSYRKLIELFAEEGMKVQFGGIELNEKEIPTQVRDRSNEFLGYDKNHADVTANR